MANYFDINSDEDLILKYVKDENKKNGFFASVSISGFESFLGSEEVDLDADSCDEFMQLLKELEELYDKYEKPGVHVADLGEAAVRKIMAEFNNSKVCKNNRLKLVSDVDKYWMVRFYANNKDLGCYLFVDRPSTSITKKFKPVTVDENGNEVEILFPASNVACDNDQTIQEYVNDAIKKAIQNTWEESY